MNWGCRHNTILTWLFWQWFVDSFCESTRHLPQNWYRISTQSWKAHWTSLIGLLKILLLSINILYRFFFPCFVTYVWLFLFHRQIKQIYIMEHKKCHDTRTELPLCWSRQESCYSWNNILLPYKIIYKWLPNMNYILFFLFGEMNYIV